ncbi:hypothetical protein SNE40_007918 [Patella caerulea]|uniref:TIR domain-containing protein n=1 Tax=Patella caerulea TaxID=87958 RepID=A0AAN8Q308_PATCE
MAEEDDGDEPLLVGVEHLSDLAESTHSVGVILLEKKSDRSLPLTHLRKKLISCIPSLPSKFIFCTKQRWPILESQESMIKISTVSSDDNVVYIKHKYDLPKIGLKTRSGLVLGFVFIDLSKKLHQMRSLVSEEIVMLMELNDNYVFLDANGWPVRRELEDKTVVMEVINNYCVTIASDMIQVENLISSDLNYKMSSVTSKSLETPPKKKIKKMRELTFCTSKDMNRPSSSSEVSCNDISLQSKQLLISYVRAEAAEHALHLKNELSNLGFSVYLDVDEIKSGVDWQDSLNYAVSNCQIFLPLITPQYGETQWTNREIKLADVLGKYILPINFLEHWPPRCLAIQFATTQYIGWKTPTQISTDIAIYGECYAKDIRYWDTKYITLVAESIADRLHQIVDNELERLPSLKRRKTLMKTFCGKLPNGVMSQVSEESTISESRRPTVVICVHPCQILYAGEIKKWLNNEGYDVWCSTDRDISIDDSDTLPASQDSNEYSKNGATEIDNEYIQCFQEKADQADVVMVILCKKFASSRTCQQQVYYCEHRKEIIPLQLEDVCLPGWLSMLIGSKAFQHVNQKGYKKLLHSQIQRCIDPTAKDSLQREINLAKSNAAISHIKRAIKNPASIYISGSTKFYNPKTEEICKSVGLHLNQLKNITIVTGGFHGVGETVSNSFYKENERLKKKHQVWHILPEKDPQDRHLQARQGTDGRFEIIPFGKTLFCGDDVHERETLVARSFDICILIEGGPGSAHETEQFVWNDRVVIPVRCTGGAAGGKFNVPDKIFQLPQGVNEEDWLKLSSKNISPDQIGQSVTNIVESLLTRLLNEDRASMISSKMVFNSKSPKTPSPSISPSTARPSLSTMKTVLLG